MTVINQKIKNGGIDPSYYDRTAKAESNGNPNAKNSQSSARGLFQFTTGTWRAVVGRYGLGYSDNDRFDKYKSKEVMEYFTKENADQLKNYGIEPNNTDLYTAHFMGVGGAHKLLSAQRENPNQSVYSVATSAQINANKTIFLNKNGSPKTVGEVYQILGDKINKTSNYKVNYEKPSESTNKYSDISTTPLPQISNFDKPIEFSNLAEIENEQKVENAKLELQQKQNEENLFNDLMKASQLQYVDPNQVQDYTEELQPQAEYQDGGIVKDDNGYWNPKNWGKPVEINSNLITMQGVNQPLLGISNQTGERKLMMPGVKNYRFKNTKQVTEYPI